MASLLSQGALPEILRRKGHGPRPAAARQSRRWRPRVRSHRRFRNRGTESLRESGIKRMRGRLTRRCGRARWRPRPGRRRRRSSRPRPRRGTRAAPCPAARTARRRRPAAAVPRVMTWSGAACIGIVHASPPAPCHNDRRGARAGGGARTPCRSSSRRTDGTNSPRQPRAVGSFPIPPPMMLCLESHP